MGFLAPPINNRTNFTSDHAVGMTNFDSALEKYGVVIKTNASFSGYQLLSANRFDGGTPEANYCWVYNSTKNMIGNGTVSSGVNCVFNPVVNLTNGSKFYVVFDGNGVGGNVKRPHYSGGGIYPITNDRYIQSPPNGNHPDKYFYPRQTMVR
jgi:hypothetical protein